MTFIQPHKQTNMMNAAIALLVVLILGGTFWTVMAYEKTVDMAHDIASMKSELDNVGAENTVLSNQVIAVLGGNQASDAAATGGLVQEKNPKYFAVTQSSWAIASQ